MEDETRARSLLTPDERAEVASFLRAIETGVGGERLARASRSKARALADKLEAEPEPACTTCGDRGWVVEGSLYDGSAEQLQCPNCEKYRTPEHIIRERDEAREVLRELEGHLTAYLANDPHFALPGYIHESLARARAVLEGAS